MLARVSNDPEVLLAYAFHGCVVDITISDELGNHQDYGMDE